MQRSIDTAATRTNWDTQRPGFDPDVAAALAGMAPLPPLTDETLEDLRVANGPGPEEVLAACADRGLIYEEHIIAGPRGDIAMSVIRPSTPVVDAAMYYTIHGGGMVTGTRFISLALVEELDWVVEHGMVLVTPEYRLAPEHPAPSGVEDCYAGLVWAASQAKIWGADAGKIVVGGGSGGGGLAAGTILMARDAGEVDVFAQILLCPMLDDRNQTASSHQYAGEPGTVWPRGNNEWAWNALLGHGHADREVSEYSAPSRARDLSGLPTTFIDVGSAEVFRDECVEYASRLWAAGVQAELHVWRGGSHAFDLFAPTSLVGRMTRAARADWLRRILA
jgi:acetyl esterase/lipase